MCYNLLFLMADQFVYNAFGHLNPAIQTPNLDRLASRAINFSNCYTNSPLCMPARAALATGLYPEELGAMVTDTTPTAESLWLASPSTL